jgi:hypothetical protein
VNKWHILPYLFPILFPCRRRIPTRSRARSAPLPGRAWPRCSLAVNLSWPSSDAAVACCSRIFPPALTKLSRLAGGPESPPLHAPQGSLHSHDSILAAVPPSPPEATIGRVLSKIWFLQQERNQQQGSARCKLNEMAAAGRELLGVEEEQVRSFFTSCLTSISFESTMCSFSILIGTSCSCSF